MRKSDARNLQQGDRVTMHDGEFTGVITLVTDKLVAVRWDDGMDGVWFLADEASDPDGLKYVEREVTDA